MKTLVNDIIFLTCVCTSKFELNGTSRFIIGYIIFLKPFVVAYIKKIKLHNALF